MRHTKDFSASKFKINLNEYYERSQWWTWKPLTCRSGGRWGGCWWSVSCWWPASTRRPSCHWCLARFFPSNWRKTSSRTRTTCRGAALITISIALTLSFDTQKTHRMRHCALLLTAIFSRGEPMPVHYFEQLGSNFVSFVLDYIEVHIFRIEKNRLSIVLPSRNFGVFCTTTSFRWLCNLLTCTLQKAPPTADSDHEIPDVFTGLALAYNLQFTDIATNVTVSCLAGKAGAKVSMGIKVWSNEIESSLHFVWVFRCGRRRFCFCSIAKTIRQTYSLGWIRMTSSVAEWTRIFPSPILCTR